MKLLHGFGRFENKQAPDRVLVFREGDLGIDGWEGFTLDEKQAKALIAHFIAKGNDLPIDYEHATNMAPKAGCPKAPAAGWVKGLEYVAGEGLYAKVEWLDTARAEIESGAYRYYSPTCKVNEKTHKLVELTSLGLTNQPATRNMLPLAAKNELEIVMNKNKDAKKKPGARELLADTLAAQADMDEPKFPAVSEDMKAVADLMTKLNELGAGLEEDASLGEVVAAAIGMLGEKPSAESAAASEAAAKLAKELGTDVKKIGATVAELQLKAARYDEMATRLATLETERTKDKTEVWLSGHVDAGRLNPNDAKQMAAARKLYAESPAEAEQLIASMQPIVEPGSATKGATAPKDARAKLAAEAAKEWEDKPQLRLGASKASYVDAALMQDGQHRLSAAEKESLGLVKSAK